MRVIAVVTLLAGSVAARPRSAAAQAPDLQDSVALGAFLDGIIAVQMDQFRIPSAAVVVVKDGRVIYTRGYGRANIAKDLPVDPGTTMFHIGSTGKLFTWTAVMQLVEQGKLDLDADVNRYLETFQIPATFPEPITLRHLMTHTAGFQEGLLGYFIGNDTTHIHSIEETLREHVPARVRPPGKLASYSNYGASLAGLIVEQVSGEPFAQYIERHIYQPLGIRYATFREPIPPDLRPYAAVGYEPENGVFVPQPPEIDGGFVPSGGTVMATLDMARFMIAHLEGGEYEGGRILEPATLALMHRTAFTHDPRLPGLGLGFIESDFNGHRVIGHDGDSQDFHVGMWLLPEARVGIYCAYGASGGGTAREQLARAFFDRYFPRVDPLPAAALPARPLDRYAGAYRIIRMNYTDVDKVIWAFLPPITVEPVGGDRLLLTGGVGPDARPGQFVPIGGDLFREVGGGRTIGFALDSSGRAGYLFTDPTVDNERVPWTERQSLWDPLLIGSGLILLGALAGRYYRRRDIRSMPPSERRAARLLGWTAGWLFLTVIAVGLVVMTYQQALLERIPAVLKAALVMPVVFVILTVWLAVEAVQIWRRQSGTLGGRLHHTAVTLAAIAVSWFFYQWNILGWQFG